MAGLPHRLSKRPLAQYGDLTAYGDATVSGLLTADAGVCETVQSLTGAACSRPGTTAGTRILGYGITKVELTQASATGAANYDLKLNGPVAVGVHKTIFVSHTGASTYMTKIMSTSTADAATFFGTTANSILLTTDWVSPITAGFHLVGITTAQWAVVAANAASSQWAVVSSTFGTT